MAHFDDLRAIERLDPDGGEREPTQDDYDAHRAWAIRMFGEATWRAYQAGGWGEEHRHADAYDLDDY